MGAVGGGPKIYNKLCLLRAYRNVRAIFGVSSFYNSQDLCAHTDRWAEKQTDMAQRLRYRSLYMCIVLWDLLPPLHRFEQSYILF